MNIELLKRYDRPGPRYTSYPTAPLFKKDFGPKEFESVLEMLHVGPQKTPVSLYFHIPFCESLCYFCGCNMMVTRDREKIAHYLEILKKEITLFSRYISNDRKVVQLHFGGGTPSHLKPDEILMLAEAIHKHFSLEKNLEAAAEIDPRRLSFAHLKAFKEAGFNRLSMGVQDFHEPVQKAIHRIQPESVTQQALDWARELGFKSINIDLIYGLPLQTKETFKQTLDRIVALNPDRLAVFNYAHVPWLKKHMTLIRSEDLPSPDQKLLMLEETFHRLSEAGYQYIGLDHFAKPHDELSLAQKNKTLRRNFQGYSTHAQTDVYAMGISAISQFDAFYAQNAKTIPEYEAAISEGRFATHVGYAASDDDRLRRDVIHELMCNFELDTKKIEKKFGIDFEQYFSNEIEKLAEFKTQGFLRFENQILSIENEGRFLARNIVMVFDAYLEKMATEKPIFSRTV